MQDSCPTLGSDYSSLQPPRLNQVQAPGRVEGYARVYKANCLMLFQMLPNTSYQNRGLPGRTVARRPDRSFLV